MSTDHEHRTPYLGRRWLVGLALAGAAFIVAALASLQYRGLINTMGEWQFARLGFYLPMISVMAWVGLVGLLLWLLARLLFRRGEAARAELPLLRERGTFLRNALMALGFLAGLVALAGAVNLLLLPRTGDRDRIVTPAQVGPGVEGSARLQGFRVAGPMARYSEGVLLWKYDIYLVPLAGGDGAGGTGPIRVFAQVSPYEAATRVPAGFRGILRSAALPRELYPLYAGQGVIVDDNAAVLYRDSFAMALSSLLLIGEGAAVALGAFLTAYIVHRRRRRISLPAA